MMTFRAGAPGGVAQAAAYTAHLLERTIDPAQQALADYYGRETALDPERAEGLGSTPRPSPVMAPEVARALGIDASRPLTAGELGNILGGLRADGGVMPGHQREQRVYRNRADGAEGSGERSRIAWIDLTFSAPKSVSVAWMAAATEAERHSIHQAHKDAVREALGYVEQQVARATFGHGRSGKAEETGRLGFVSIDHFTSRPTVEISRADPTTGVQATEIYSVPVAGDPQLHTHTIVPNLVLTRSGRAMSIDTTRIAGRVHEFGAVYQALLGRNLRQLGMAVELEGRTQALRLAAIPEEICRAFSKRTVNGERSAEEWARRHGYSAEAWAGLRPEQRIAMLKAAIKEGRFGKGDDLADRAAWQAQIAELGWQYGGSAVRMGPPAPERRPGRGGTSMPTPAISQRCQMGTNRPPIRLNSCSRLGWKRHAAMGHRESRPPLPHSLRSLGCCGRLDLPEHSERGLKKSKVILDRPDLSLKGRLQHAYEKALYKALYPKQAFKVVGRGGGSPPLLQVRFV